jgi:hypothetical protein
MNTEARRLMEKADHALAVADDLIKNRYPADAASNCIMRCSMLRRRF